MILLTRDSMVDKCSLSSSRDTNLEVKLSLNSKIPTLPRCLIVWSARAFPAATTHLLQIVRSSMVAQLIQLSLLNLIKQLSEITQWQSTRQIMRLDPGSAKMRLWQILFNWLAWSTNFPRWEIYRLRTLSRSLSEAMRWQETYTVRTRMVRISSSSYQIWWRRSRGLIKRMEAQLICVISSKTQCQMQQLMQSTHMDSSKCPRTIVSLRSPSSRCSRVLESLLLLIRTRVIRIKLSRSQISDSLSASQDLLSLLQMTIRAITIRVSHLSRAPRIISPMLVH